MFDEVYDRPVPHTIQRWSYVYRMHWYQAGTGKTITRRVTKADALRWRDTFEQFRKEAHDHDQPWNDRMLIEQAQVGPWSSIYERP